MKNTLEVLPTGSLRLDAALITGGYPAGALVEISGPESSGKTLLCQATVAQAQKMGAICAWIDTDHMFCPNFAIATGMHMNQTIYAAPTNAETALGMMEILAASGAVKVIVLDSIHALIPAFNSSDEFHEIQNSHAEELLSSSLSRLKQYAKLTGVIIIMTSDLPLQLSRAYYRLAAHPNRLAVKLRTNIQIKLLPSRMYEGMTSKQRGIYHLKVVKNDFIVPFFSRDFDIIYPLGVNKIAEIFELGIYLRCIVFSDGRLSYQNHILGRFPDEALTFLENHPEIAGALELEIHKILFFRVE